jgi:orotate phosphoribosyltransferase
MSDRERLLELVRGCVHKGEVILASGAKSDFYLDARLVTLTTLGSRLVGQAALDHARELGATGVAGPTVAACPIVSAVGVLADQAAVPLKLSYVRAAAKGHGMQKAVEGPPLGPEDKVLIVDDVMTSGGSLLKAVDQLKETGCQVLGAWCIVDRQAGGRERVEEAGVPFAALFTRAEVQGA